MTDEKNPNEEQSYELSRDLIAEREYFASMAAGTIPPNILRIFTIKPTEPTE